MKGGELVEWTPEAIRGFKDRHKLTAPAMAELLGINRSYVFLLMKGQYIPSSILCKLLDCLDEKLQTTTETGKEKHNGKAQRNLSKG
jgi:DNA-binding XRE family transcriptional regulator